MLIPLARRLVLTKLSIIEMSVVKAVIYAAYRLTFTPFIPKYKATDSSIEACAKDQAGNAGRTRRARNVERGMYSGKKRPRVSLCMW